MSLCLQTNLWQISYNLQINFLNQLLENWKKKEFIHHLKTIWGVDLADMELISKYNRRNYVFVMAIDLLNKYAWVVPLKDKKGITIVNAFQRVF